MSEERDVLELSKHCCENFRVGCPERIADIYTNVLGKTSPRLHHDFGTTKILNPSIKGDWVSNYCAIWWQSMVSQAINLY